MRELSLKQRSFIDNYIANNGNGAEAARLAGYKGNDDVLKSVACENLTKPYIKQAIEAKRAEIEPKLEITVNKVLLNLEEARIAAFAKGDFSSAIRAGELQGKQHGMFKDVLDLNSNEQAKALTETEQLEAQRIANIRLRTG